MADERPGFEIDGRRYPFPESFRLGDPVLVAELSGMPFPEFAEKLQDEEERKDPAVLIGLVGVAVWQGNPRWRRARVVEYVQQIDTEGFEAFGGDGEDEPEGLDEGAVELPPVAPADEPAPSNESLPESNDSTV